jgi:uncharacterized membrane protein
MPYSLVMPAGTALLLTIHLAATAAMAGLIWFVQVNHYPLFDRVGPDRFVDYEQDHQRLTSWVVGPFMAVEGVTALLIAATERDTVGTTLVIEGLVLLAVIHASTVFLQVPAHTRLSSGYDRAVVRRLVVTNWIRTIGWSARTVVAGAMIVVAST